MNGDADDYPMPPMVLPILLLGPVSQGSALRLSSEEITRPERVFFIAIERKNQMTTFPYKSGDFTVIGPECFTDSEARIIAYKGSNYVRVPDETTIVRIASTEEAARLAANHAAFERECPPIQPEPQWTTNSSLREAGIQHDGDPA